MVTKTIWLGLNEMYGPIYGKWIQDNNSFPIQEYSKMCQLFWSSRVNFYNVTIFYMEALHIF